MSRAFIIPPTVDLVEEVIKHLTPDGSDYSRNLVVFPGKRPAHFVRRLLGEKLGHAFIPPRLLSIDNFVDFIYTEQLGLAQRQLQPIDAVAILHEIHRNSSERFGGTSFDELDAFLPLGLKLFGELEELRMANLPKRKLDDVLAGVTIGSVRPLSSVYAAFYQKVNALGCTTRALKYTQVADAFSEHHLHNVDSVVVAGFFALTEAERTIFLELKKMDSVVFLFQHGKGLAKHLKELDLTPEQGPQTQSVDRTNNIHFYQSPDSHGQVFGLTGKMQERLTGNSPLDERTVIVLPSSETLLPLYHQTLGLLKEGEYNISLGYPATRTPVFGFLQSLMDLVSSMHEGKFYAPDYMRFVLHPYTKNVLFEGRPDVTRILFHSIEQHLAGEKSRTFFSLEELEREVQLFSDVAERVAALEVESSAQVMRQHLAAIHENTIRRLVKARTLGSMAQACMDVLTHIDEHSTARRHPLFRPYVETLIESLNGIASSMLADAVFADQSRAMAFLARCVADAQVPFPGTPLNGLQVLGFLETRNLRFDTVFVLDVNEDVIPGAGGGHTLIPQQIREKLGLPTYHQQEEIAAHYFDVLISGAQEVHLFFSENAQKEKSRFVEELLWERQQRDGKDEAREYILSIGYKVWLANAAPESTQKRSEVVDYLRQFTYHSTALDMYLSCPLRFYYSYILGLQEKEEVAGDIDSSDVGSFVHEVLKTYFKDTIGKRLTPEDFGVARLNRILDEQFPLWFGVEHTGAKHLLQRQVRTQLGHFLSDYQRSMCNKEVITLLELESKVQRLSKNHFTFSGKLDRVERRGEKIFILDYKTGGDEKRLGINFGKLVVDQRDTWGDAIGSLQLPMYMMLYSESRQKSVEEIVPAYLLLGRNKIDEEIELRLFEDGIAVGEVYAKLERIIFSLLDEITNVAVPFAPTNDIQEHCPRCPFTTMCGTGWVKKPAS